MVLETTPNKQPRKASRETPLVESEVRRSDRIKHLKKGFKSSSCVDKGCLACASEPPSLSPSVIKGIGSLCKISDKELNEATLKKKKTTKEPIGAKGKKIVVSNKASNEDKPNKKPKKDGKEKKPDSKKKTFLVL
ncbi:hypothetical protein EJB05_00668, partial [Eragrostis curvula]